MKSTILHSNAMPAVLKKAVVFVAVSIVVAVSIGQSFLWWAFDFFS